MELKIKSVHFTLAAAVEAAKLDLSYNPAAAAQSIKDSDSGFNGRCHGTTKAFVTEDNEVWHVFRTGDGINFLHKFEPFISVLSNAGLRPAYFQEKDGAMKVSIMDVTIPNNKKGRSAFATFCESHNFFAH